MAESPTPRGDLRVLDALRGVAALVVVLGHAYVLLIRLNPYVSPTLPIGHEAVIMFFVISGFCIHYRQAGPGRATVRHSAGEVRSNVADYARRRFRRIYPPFFTAVVLTLALDQVGRMVSPTYYTYYTANGGLLASTLLLQGGLLTNPVGTNGALWSMAYEFWFYVLYPFIWLLASVRLRLSAAVVAFVSGGALLLVVTGHTHKAYIAPAVAVWGIWFVGALMAEAYAGRFQLPPLWVYVLAAGSFFVVCIGTRESVFLDYGYAALYVLLLQLLLFPIKHNFLAPVARWLIKLEPLGRISYSLYLVHVPIMVLMSAYWLTSHSELPTTPFYAILGIVVSMGCAIGAYNLVEKRFMNRKKNWSGAAVQLAAS